MCLTFDKIDSVLAVLQTLLAGFYNTGPFKLIFPDELHQAMKGDQEHLIHTVEQLPASDQHLVNMAVLASPMFSGLRLPSGGLEYSKAFAQQLAALFKVLPVALLAAEDSALAVSIARVMLGE